jgi:peptidoglycan hydrolase-like protein with peptidoglycan-binding domain
MSCSLFRRFSKQCQSNEDFVMPLTSPRFKDSARLQKAAENDPPLKIGEPKGDGVARVQQALSDLGYAMPITFAKGSPDGIYGKETAAVVQQFQKDQGFPPSGWDGRAGRDTLTRLDQLFPPPVPVPPRPPLPPPPIPPRRGGELPPVPLLPDPGQLLFAERNVDIHGAMKTVAAYDLALFRELGNPSRGVLVVTVIMNFKFKDGVGTLAPNLGKPLTWTTVEKNKFMADFKVVIEGAWSERHRITTVGTATPVSDVGVIYNILTFEDMSIFRHSHWNLTTTKVDHNVTSTTDTRGGSFFTNGDADLDSFDLQPRDKGGPETQRGAVHEFGHMMGFDDEYSDDGKAVGNTHFLNDLGAVMNRSEQIRRRHYVFLADWLSQKSPPTTVWRVDGVIDLTNAQV